MVAIVANSAFTPAGAESLDWDMAGNEIRIQAGAMYAQFEKLKGDISERLTEAIHSASFH